MAGKSKKTKKNSKKHDFSQELRRINHEAVIEIYNKWANSEGEEISDEDLDFLNENSAWSKRVRPVGTDDFTTVWQGDAKKRACSDMLDLIETKEKFGRFPISTCTSCSKLFKQKPNGKVADYCSRWCRDTSNQERKKAKKSKKS